MSNNCASCFSISYFVLVSLCRAFLILVIPFFLGCLGNRRIRLEVFSEKVVPKNFGKIHSKTLVLESLF